MGLEHKDKFKGVSEVPKNSQEEKIIKLSSEIRFLETKLDYFTDLVNEMRTCHNCDGYPCHNCVRGSNYRFKSKDKWQGIISFEKSPLQGDIVTKGNNKTIDIKEIVEKFQKSFNVSLETNEKGMLGYIHTVNTQKNFNIYAQALIDFGLLENLE